MIVKYKDKEYNIELSVEYFKNIKQTFKNGNEFYYFFKYVSSIIQLEFKYDDILRNKCKICGNKCSNLYCKSCYGKGISEKAKNKSREEKEAIKEKRFKTNLEKYGSKAYNHKVGDKTKLEKYGSKNNIKKVMQTNLEKYGFKCVAQVPEFREKLKQTNLEKYGVEFPFQSNEIQIKVKESVNEKYGVENISHLESTRLKVKESVNEKYGVENISQCEEIQDKIKLNNIKKYGYIHTSKIPEVKEKIRNTNIERYGSYIKNGEIKPITSRSKHLNNTENFNYDFISSTFIKDNRFLMDEFLNYFNIQSRSTGYIFKKELGILTQNKINIAKTQQFIFDSIKTENKVFNDRTVLNGKELDIYLPDIKLAIEYNGLLYHSEGYTDIQWLSNTDKNYHLDKTNQCLEKGIQLFHIFEGENLDLWLSMINNKLGLNERIFARKCEIRELANKDIINFLNDNHIQGYVQSKINLGLFFQNKLVSVMTFSKPRFNKRYEYELIRFCSLKNTSVIGGANKLLKYFINKYHPKSIISYANRRFSNGSIYETLGFKKIGVSTPNYFYFKDSSVLESRNKYQKHKLSKLLSDFDPSLSESENMFKNGYRRIYDCGNLVYELIL